MKLEDFRKIKAELKKQKELNDVKIRLNNEKTRMAEENQFACKVVNTFLFLVIGLVPLSISLIFLGPVIFTSIFPDFSFPIVIVGSLLGIGTIFRKIRDKKYKIKERIKAFSKAKTEAEKIEEEIHYQTELEKAKNRNQVLNQALADVNSNEAIFKAMSDQYGITEKKPLQTKEETEQSIQELSTLIKEKYNKLDLLTAKKVLHDNFVDIRKKDERIIQKIGLPFIFSMIFFMLMLILTISLMKTIPLTTLLVGLLSSEAAAIGASIGYTIRMDKNMKKAFDNLNSKLGNDALEPEIKDNYKEVESIISELELCLADYRDIFNMDGISYAIYEIGKKLKEL